MKNILIINGHPNKESYNYALANAYKKGLDQTVANYTEINITDLKFNANLGYGYQKRTELEDDLKWAIDKIKNADHIVWIYPMWWYGQPAIMKGFIDRTFLPGITFQPGEGKFHKKLLKGKTARIIVTADTPRWYDYLFMKSPSLNQLKKGTLAFCGVGPIKITYISPIKNSSAEFRNKWLSIVEKLGLKLK